MTPGSRGIVDVKYANAYALKMGLRAALLLSLALDRPSYCMVSTTKHRNDHTIWWMRPLKLHQAYTFVAGEVDLYYASFGASKKVKLISRSFWTLALCRRF